MKQLMSYVKRGMVVAGGVRRRGGAAAVVGRRDTSVRAVGAVRIALAHIVLASKPRLLPQRKGRR